jgi:hypothetical protein
VVLISGSIIASIEIDSKIYSEDDRFKWSAHRVGSVFDGLSESLSIPANTEFKVEMLNRLEIETVKSADIFRDIFRVRVLSPKKYANAIITSSINKYSILSTGYETKVKVELSFDYIQLVDAEGVARYDDAAFAKISAYLINILGSDSVKADKDGSFYLLNKKLVLEKGTQLVIRTK